MALFTLITRVADGLPFMESTEAISQQIKEQAKSISKRLDSRSDTRLRVDCGGQVITYLVEDGLCFLVVTDAAYQQRLTLSFLISLHREFTAYMRQQDGEAAWRQQLDTCARPYAYQGFTSAGLLQLRRDYADQNSSKAQRLAEELHDVHSIMRKNIQEVLQRGENLDHLSKVSSKLASDSKTFKWGAKKLNYLDALSKFFPCLAIVAFVGLLYVWRFYFF